VRRRKSRRLQPLRDGVGRLRHVAGRRVGRVDFDQLLEQVSCALIVRRRWSGRHRERKDDAAGDCDRCTHNRTILKTMKFAPEYVTYVLNENFEDAKTLFLSPLMAIHHAHLVMLADRGIVSANDAHSIRVALDGISPDRLRDLKYDGSCEDLFFYVERLIADACGED